MKIRLASDLHIDAFRGMTMNKLTESFLENNEGDIDSVLVLAGDISSDPKQVAEFIQYVAHRFLDVIYVPGNHEYYKHELGDWRYKLEREFSDLPFIENLHSIQGSVVLQNVKFIYTTLWGECSHDHFTNQEIGRYINDFHWITKHGQRFRPDQMRDLAEREKAFIKYHLFNDRVDGQKVVVITHHMPSYNLVSDRFKISNLNGAFVNSCDDILMGDQAPELWLFGHTHDTIDKTIGETRFVCNPSGYRGEWNTQFNTYMLGPKFIEV